MYKQLYLLAFTFLLHLSHAQTFECGTDYLHEQRMNNDPAYKQQFIQLQHSVDSIISTRAQRGTQSAVYTIPVVVHVIHLGEPVGTGTNISDAQIKGAINGLNNRWRNIIGNGVDIEIQFCLANKDPNGNFCSGINRVDGSILPNYAANGISLLYSNCDAPSEDSVKRLSRWPVSKYYNIWVVNEICKNISGYIGVADYPNGGVNDGTVVDYHVMDSVNNALPHELGHAFFLYHTFQGDNTGCPLDTNCSINGDKVCDTPPHKRNDCGSSNPCSSSGTWNNTLHNYMSYCGAADRFTQGQKDRVRATAIVSPRLSLLSSNGCSSALGISAFDGSVVTIAPNPFSGQLTCSVSNNEPATVSLYNFLGQQTLQQTFTNTATINTEQLASGIYFYVLQTRGEIIKTGTVLKQ